MKIFGVIGSALCLFVFVWAVYTHHLNRQAHTLFHDGAEHGDIQKLTAANDCFAAMLRLQPRALLPLDWAQTQSNRAAILRMLGADGALDGQAGGGGRHLS